MKPFPFSIPGIKPEDLAVLRNMKDYTQYVATVEKLLAGVCPFCPVLPPNEIIFTTKCWVAFHSIFPQKHQSHHLVIAHKEHIGHFRGLTHDDWADFGNMMDWIDREFNFPGGGLGLRFGPVEYHIGSVPGHLHWNIQVPDGSGTVALWLAKDEKEIEAADARAVVFEKIRLGTAYEDLSAEDKDTIQGRYPRLENT